MIHNLIVNVSSINFDWICQFGQCKVQVSRTQLYEGLNKMFVNNLKIFDADYDYSDMAHKSLSIIIRNELEIFAHNNGFKIWDIF